MRRKGRLTPVAALGGGVSYDPATTAWVNGVVTAGGTVSATQEGYVDTLIKYLKAHSAWSSGGLDACWLYASENAQQAMVDIVGLTSHTLHGSPTFTANRGYTGDGSAAYIDTGFNPTSRGVNYTANNACFGFYLRTEESRTAAAYYYAGTDNNTAGADAVRLSAGGVQHNFGINITGIGKFIGFDSGPVTGRYHIERTTSSLCAVYRNGISVGTNTQTPTALPNANFFTLCSNNNSGTAQNLTNAQLGCFYVGASGIVAAMDAALSSYFASVGA